MEYFSLPVSLSSIYALYLVFPDLIPSNCAVLIYTLTGRPLAIESPLDDDEDGLPSPPMDEGALLTGQTASLEMYQVCCFITKPPLIYIFLYEACSYTIFERMSKLIYSVSFANLCY